MDVVDVIPGLHLLRLGIANAYLWHDGDGATLVDTGPPGSGPAVAAAMESVGLRRQDLRRIVLTHFHDDHAGSAAEIASWSAHGWSRDARTPRSCAATSLGRHQRSPRRSRRCKPSSPRTWSRRSTAPGHRRVRGVPELPRGCLPAVEGVGVQVVLLTDAGDVTGDVGEAQTRMSLVLWNPWFVLGGLFFVAAGVQSRRARS